jgi:hypothetical protein
MEMNTKIILENCDRVDNDLIIQPDRMGDGSNYITFSITVDGDRIPLSEKELYPDMMGDETYFSINKAQAKVLISYLQSLVDDM